MRITREFLENVLKLKNVRDCGDNFMASCPFEFLHTDGKDSNPSFGIHKESGLWHCFACGEKGGLTNLVSRVLDKPPLVAAEIINGYFSQKVDIEKLARKIKSFEEALNTENIKTTNLLPQGYTKNLPKNVINFFQNRGISKGVLEEFEVGFCSEGVYKDMIIFPVFVNNFLTGFVARVVGENVVGKKYLLPKGFRKALYNLSPIEGCVYLVEGPLDVLKLYTLGLRNACALFGSSIDYFQVRLLIKHGVREVVVMLDGDVVGRNATKKVVELIKPFFSKVSILNLPDGLDPCDISERTVLRMLLRSVMDL